MFDMALPSSTSYMLGSKTGDLVLKTLGEKLTIHFSTTWELSLKTFPQQLD